MSRVVNQPIGTMPCLLLVLLSMVYCRDVTACLVPIHIALKQNTQTRPSNVSVICMETDANAAYVILIWLQGRSA